ncbi:transcriptional regulator [Paenibacillus marchantiophytorum]|uniref:Transcriptional regulator n=1 Tax=Paenibacillus marchantiophytorum TaxID=1619310 RepID=A0ABQ1EUW2_9BACL|nr:helix-turn-helix transcriptional regulator [Paenibacillus marchantiophytorum]GFZ87047.1 transcriptional regulator [Paenibacillus marchantiophytorum]
MTDLVLKLGERLRYIRKEQNLSQEQLGELAGLHTNYIGQVERGEKNVTIESLEKIAAGLNVSMEQLFRYIDPMEREDELSQINELLATRSMQDKAMVLKMIKDVFDWEASKYK